MQQAHSVCRLRYPACSMIWSISPYSRASSADMKRSRSVSFSIFSKRVAGMLDEDAVEAFLDLDELLGVDQDVLGGAFHAGQGLVDHDAGIGQGLAFAGRAGGQQHGAHRGALADAVGGHVAIDELHGVVDGHAGGDASARRIDVHVDVGLGIFRLQEEQLGDDGVGHFVVDLRAEKDDAVFQQAAVDVHRPLFAAALLDDVWNQRHGCLLQLRFTVVSGQWFYGNCKLKTADLTFIILPRLRPLVS